MGLHPRIESAEARPSSLDGTLLESPYSRFLRICHCRLVPIDKPAVRVLLVVTAVLNPIVLEAGNEGDECAMKEPFTSQEDMQA